MQDSVEYIVSRGTIGGPVGRMAHGGVATDYNAQGLNIINAHALTALAMLKQAGVSVNDSKFQACWSMVKNATNASSHNDRGAVGYWSTGGSGYDSMARTAGVAFGMETYGGLSAADRAVVDSQKHYVWQRWERMQHAHAYTIGGVMFTQFVLPYLEDRQQRYLMENQRFFYHFHRNTAGTLSYFGGRYNNGGESNAYLRFDRVKNLNVCLAQAIHSGNLSCFPSINTKRIHADFASPRLAWPSIEARHLTASNSPISFSSISITDHQGAVLNNSDYSVQWSHISGPGIASFTSPNSLQTDVMLTAAGRMLP